MNYLNPDVIDFAVYAEMTENATRVKSAKDYTDEVISFLHDESTPSGATLPWRKTQNLLRFRPSEVTVWCGYNGHGKSLMLGQALLGFIAQNEASCIASLEMKPVATLARMDRQAEGVSRPSPEFIREFHETVGSHLWLYDQMGMVNPDTIIGVVNYAATVIGCKHFVLDSMTKCGIDEDDLKGQKRFIDRLCTVARDTEIHIHLVAHSRKGKDELTPPGKMDVRGAASITDQVDNVLTVYRNKAKSNALDNGDMSLANDPDALLICSKQRHGDWEGTFGLWFDPASQQFLEAQSIHPSNLIDPRIYKCDTYPSF